MKADRLLNLLHQNREVYVNPSMFNYMFDAPSYVDPLKQLALTMNGNRPEMDQREQLKTWCDIHDVEYRYNPINGNHYFRLKN